LNLLGTFLFNLFEGDSEHAVLELGLDAFLVDRNWQREGTAKLTPVAFLDMPVLNIGLVTAS